MDINISVSSNKTSSINLGIQGENIVERIIFNISEWITEYGEGVAYVYAKRKGDTDPYPIALDMDMSRGTATWEVSSVDTAIKGKGSAQLVYVVDEDKIKKTKIYATTVQTSLIAVSADAPVQYETWLEVLGGYTARIEAANIAGQTAKDLAQAAQAAAELAQSEAEKAQKAAETAQGKAEDAQGKAETAQELAETARAAAERAQGKAEDAQEASETAQGKAETAQGKAETAQEMAESARDAAREAQSAAELAETRAEESEANAATSAENALLYMTNARDAIANAICEPFDASVDYSLGDFVFRDGMVYVCKAEGAQEWSDSNWERVLFASEVEKNAAEIDILKPAVAILQTESSDHARAISTNTANISNIDTRLVEVEELTRDHETEIDGLNTKMTTFCEELEVDEDGLVYILNNGERIAGPYGPFAGGGSGGGSSGNNAVFAVQNVTGWLSKTIAEGAECTISVAWSSTEDEIPTGNGTMKISVNGASKATFEVAQGTVTVELSRYLGSGANAVRIQISDVYGNSRTINFSVNAVSLSLTSSFDSTAAYSGAIQFAYTPVGSVAKVVHFIVDGTEIGTQTTSVSGRQLSYTIPAQSHGGHTFRVYFESQINDETVRSNELYYEIICTQAGNTTPIITSNFNRQTATQYESIQIPYMVYNPEALSAEVVLSANGAEVSRQTVDRTEQTFTYRANDAGRLTFAITSGETTKTIMIEVSEADIDIEAETESLALYLTAQGRSNQEENPATWTSGNISASFQGFNWASDGWQKDAEGISVMRVNGDARITIPYRIFAEDFRRTGKTIEVEFATRNVLNYDSTIMSCMSGGRGFTLTAQKALLTSEQSEISTQYKEDEHVRISFVAEKRTENRLLLIYINGIASGTFQYPENDDFSQVSPVDISIGSSDCTIDIYNIRVYDNDLTRHQILNNWIADTQVGSTMMDRFNHNNVYDAYGNVVISQLPNDLPFMIITCPELPQYKGDKKDVSGSYTDPMYPSRSFTFEGAQADVQGTSSQYYARKNYKIKFRGGFNLQNGNFTQTYTMNPNAVPTSTFTFKADVASSEGANNVELARLYNDTCPYKTPAQQADPKIRQGIDGFPIVIFWSNGETTQFLGKYNFNNDKGTEEVFGFASPDESWEIKNNTSDRVLWKSDDFSSMVADENGILKPAWLNDFEGRYPDGYEDPSQLAEFASWLKSTDREQATGTEFEAPVTYGDETYLSDTAAYRLAKFKAELDNYVERDSALFYYLFTELFLMVDSRAKNAFPSFIGTEV